MTTQTQQTLPPSIFPARFQILSGSALKLLACILMLIDHTGVLILANSEDRLFYFVCRSTIGFIG